MRDALKKADLFNKRTKLSLELAQFDIKYESRIEIKDQVLIEFMAEFLTSSIEKDEQLLHII